MSLQVDERAKIRTSHSDCPYAMKLETSAKFEKRHQNLSGISALSISKRSSVLGFLGDFLLSIAISYNLHSFA